MEVKEKERIRALVKKVRQILAEDELFLSADGVSGVWIKTGPVRAYFEEGIRQNEREIGQ